MYAVATFIVVAFLSMIFTRFATGALIATGLPPDVAGFQARSALTGSGFTTVEAENVVNHPLRRRIISATMLVGNLGTPTLVVSVLLAFLAPGPGDVDERFWTTLAFLAVFLFLVRADFITRWLVGVGQTYVRGRLLSSLASTYEEQLVIDDDFVVAEVRLADDPDLAPRSLRGLDQALEGARLLGIRRGGDDGGYVGEPPTDLALHADDVLVLYGRRSQLRQLTGASDQAG